MNHKKCGKEKDCEHSLAYCKVCDVVYCPKCNKEWKTDWSTMTFDSDGTNSDGTSRALDIFHNAIPCRHEKY